jgi:predicted RNA-binding Zn-ribbon protein involved in translation (DUF1610 family)
MGNGKFTKRCSCCGWIGFVYSNKMYCPDCGKKSLERDATLGNNGQLWKEFFRSRVQHGIPERLLKEQTEEMAPVPSCRHCDDEFVPRAWDEKDHHGNETVPPNSGYLFCSLSCWALNQIVKGQKYDAQGSPGRIAKKDVVPLVKDEEEDDLDLLEEPDLVEDDVG